MEERKTFLLRISPNLWKELESWAGDELRSVNGQIEYVLRQAVTKHRVPGKRRNPKVRKPGTTSDPSWDPAGSAG
ncbi:MAG: Arc family DNA binding domain-containing protein [Pedosphaera sp.]|nr:Arc family DNA binding domain-containing protein [Pedosphaera sp.]